MEKTKPKKASQLKLVLYFLGCFLVSFSLGVFIYGWSEMLVFFPPNHPRGRGALWGFAFGALLGLLFLGLANLAFFLGEKKTTRTCKNRTESKTWFLKIILTHFSLPLGGAFSFFEFVNHSSLSSPRKRGSRVKITN